MSEKIVEIERGKNLVMGASTDIPITDALEAEYSRIRYKWIGDQSMKHNIPAFIKTCSNLKEIRRTIQQKEGYKERREYINQEFKNFLDDASLLNDLDDVSVIANFKNLQLLPEDIKQKGREMSEAYLYLYCIENSMRIFVEKVACQEGFAIPSKVQQTIQVNRKQEKTRKYLPIRGNSDFFYCNFIDLERIIKHNWNIFRNYFPDENEHWISVMLGELYEIRNLIAHNGYIGENEKQSLKVYYNNILLQLAIE